MRRILGRPNPLRSAVGIDQSSASRNRWRFIHLRTQALSAQQVPPAGFEELPPGEKRRRLEAILFLSPGGINSRKSAKLAGLADATEARTLIRQLNQQYDRQGSPYRIEETAHGFTLLTRPHFASWLRRLTYVPGAIKLSQSAIETLAIVAYRQPVLRANIEAIRGVGCSEVLKQLMELDLVRISGRSEDLGRPYLYGTTKRFLQMFGLRSADRLPRIDWVNGVGLQSQSTSSQQTIEANDSETRESTVKMTWNAATVLNAEDATDVDVSLIDVAKRFVESLDDDEDELFFDDEDDEDEWDDEDEDEDEDLDDEDDLDDDADWEEVDDDDEDLDDDDWDDDEDDDLDDEDDDDDEDWD